MRLEKITQGVEVFKKTGEISEDLLPGFDQSGRWWGIWVEGQNIRVPELTYAEVPKKSLVRIAEDGSRHLLSSFCLEPCYDAEIPFTSIAGQVSCPNISQLNAPFLKSVEGDMEIEDVIILRAPKLERVGGSLQSHATEDFWAPMLKSIGRDLDITSVKTLNAPKLKSVGGRISLWDCEPPVWGSAPPRWVFDLERFIKKLDTNCLRKQIKYLDPENSRSQSKVKALGDWALESFKKELKKREIKETLIDQGTLCLD